MSSNNNGFDASGFTYGIAFVVGLIFLLVTIAFACVRLRLTETPTNIHNIMATFPSSQQQLEPLEQQHHHVHINTSTFQTYPKLLYSQELLENKDNGSRVSSLCSICLGDYKENDMLRMLPHCGHVFHQACVDPWLILHSTCPICRKSSIQGSSKPSISASNNFEE